MHNILGRSRFSRHFLLLCPLPPLALLRRSGRRSVPYFLAHNRRPYISASTTESTPALPLRLGLPDEPAEIVRFLSRSPIPIFFLRSPPVELLIVFST